MTVSKSFHAMETYLGNSLTFPNCIHLSHHYFFSNCNRAWLPGMHLLMGSSIIIRELVRNEDSWVPPQASCIRICMLARLPGDLYTLVSLRSPGVDQCIPDRQPASTLSLNTPGVRAYYPTMHHILSSTTQFLLESSCKCSLLCFSPSSHPALPGPAPSPRHQGLNGFLVPDLTLFLTLKPNLLVLDVFPQGPSVPKANNCYCSLSIYWCFTCIISFNSHDRLLLSPCSEEETGSE